MIALRNGLQDNRRHSISVSCLKIFEPHVLSYKLQDAPSTHLWESILGENVFLPIECLEEAADLKIGVIRE